MTRLRYAMIAGLLALPLGVTSPPGRDASKALADVPPHSKEHLQEHLDLLGVHFRGGMARWSNPGDRAALEKVWDVPTILGGPPYSAQSAGVLSQFLRVEYDLLRKYTTADDAKPGTPQEAVVRARYQDEIVRNSAFLVATAAATLQAIGDFASKLKPEDLTPSRREGLEQGRTGIRDILEALNAELRVAGVKSDNKMVLLDALAANASTIAAFSPQADRRSYVESAKAVLPSLSEAEKAKLQTFIGAMETKECKGLCALKG